MNSISSRVFSSAAFLLGAQLVQRSLGLISTLVLARLLTPEHFGVVALVAIALQFFDILADAGNQHYIIHKPAVQDHDLNTAWTIDLIVKTVVYGVIVLCTPALTTFFETPELTSALPIAALALPIRALRNPAMMLWAKELNYRPSFMLTLWAKVISFVTVITWALIDPGYWALIAGSLVSILVVAIGSYRLSDYRPKPALNRFREQWTFSRWVILRGLTGFTRSQIDNLVVSRLFGTTGLGGYHLVRELATFPAVSVIIPGSEPLQAAIAESHQRPADLAYRLRLSQFMMISLLTPITAYMMFDAELIVTVLLGTSWAEYAPLLRPFGLYFFTFCLFALVSDAFLAIGRVKALFVFDLISTCIILSILVTLSEPTLETLAWVRGWLAVITTAALMVQLNQVTAFGLTHTMLLSLPVCAATALGLLIVCQIQPYTINLAWSLLTLLINGGLFCLAFATLVVPIILALRHRVAEFNHIIGPAIKLLNGKKNQGG